MMGEANIMTTVVNHSDTVHVSVPATSANLGSGFDSVGLALDRRDHVTFTLGDVGDSSVEVEIHGEGEDALPRDESNLIVHTFLGACEALGLPRRALRMVAENRIPQARGMGSSAEAIVTATAAARAFAQDPASSLDREYVFAHAAEIEGHPDNVAPAVYGGLTVSWHYRHNDENLQDVNGGAIQDASIVEGFHTVNYLVSPEIAAYVFVPDFSLSTNKARRSLPDTVPYADAVFNVSRAGLLPAALESAGGESSNELLFYATQDRLHQSYRSQLMPQSAALMHSLRAHGYAAMISGAGPCVIVLHYGEISQELRQLAGEQLESGHWNLLNLPIDSQGVRVTRD
ncbi:homoserine kinase [Bifidobacterium aquikefiri]|uniref:Homoserine kinase n=2 Tax=Bifidobacterium aquikefiri TaxID=1653207 RepID=A0A261G946_9BIFI|nr:homoserine kinase [Bifidobacterium aquikefiri]